MQSIKHRLAFVNNTVRLSYNQEVQQYSKILSLADVERRLLDFVPPINSNNYDLTVVQALADYVGNPERNLRVVHIAGTSGKTTTCYYIAALLAKAGYKVGLTVSPHVVSITERVQILGGGELGEQQFIDYFTQFSEQIKDFQPRPSYFEVMMVFALWVFAQGNVDYAVVETGLGGLLDASNICRRSDKVAVITDIGFDHMEILGSTLGEIATQKAGIIAENNTCLMYRQSDEVMGAVGEAVRQYHAHLQLASEASSAVPYLRRNFDLARQVVEYLAERDGFLKLDAEALADTYQRTRVPGRLEKLRVGSTLFVLDGAHNQQKMQALCAALELIYPGRKWPAILAMKSTKDYHAVIDVIAPLLDRAIVSEFAAIQDIPIKAVAAADLAHALKEHAVTVERADSLELAAQKYIDNGAEMVLLTGSFYAIGELRAWLIGEKQAKIE